MINTQDFADKHCNGATPEIYIYPEYTAYIWTTAEDLAAANGMTEVKRDGEFVRFRGTREQLVSLMRDIERM